MRSRTHPLRIVVKVYERRPALLEKSFLALVLARLVGRHAVGFRDSNLIPTSAAWTRARPDKKSRETRYEANYGGTAICQSRLMWGAVEPQSIL
jgi:hypothetical protein